MQVDPAPDEGAATAPSFMPIRIRLLWYPQPQFAGYLVAEHLMLGATDGIRIECQPMQPDLGPVDAVLTGMAEFAVASPAHMLESGCADDLVMLLANPASERAGLSRAPRRRSGTAQRSARPPSRRLARPRGFSNCAGCLHRGGVFGQRRDVAADRRYGQRGDRSCGGLRADDDLSRTPSAGGTFGRLGRLHHLPAGERRHPAEGRPHRAARLGRTPSGGDAGADRRRSGGLDDRVHSARGSRSHLLSRPPGYGGDGAGSPACGHSRSRHCAARHSARASAFPIRTICAGPRKRSPSSTVCAQRGRSMPASGRRPPPRAAPPHGDTRHGGGRGGGGCRDRRGTEPCRPCRALVRARRSRPWCFRRQPRLRRHPYDG